MKAILQKQGLEEFSPTLQRFLDAAAKSPYFDAGELRRRFIEADQLRMKALQAMQNLDAVLLPTCATPAKKHGTTQDQITDFHYSMAFNLLSWPSCVVPCGTSQQGLPIGLQVVAPPHAMQLFWQKCEYRQMIFLLTVMMLPHKYGSIAKNIILARIFINLVSLLILKK